MWSTMSATWRWIPATDSCAVVTVSSPDCAARAVCSAIRDTRCALDAISLDVVSSSLIVLVIWAIAVASSLALVACWLAADSSSAAELCTWPTAVPICRLRLRVTRNASAAPISTAPTARPVTRSEATSAVCVAFRLAALSSLVSLATKAVTVSSRARVSVRVWSVAAFTALGVAVSRSSWVWYALSARTTASIRPRSVSVATSARTEASVAT
jgi:hypothetical protein